ncbi:hypothetical protein [Streptomyces antibioticus]|uniref:hypothetical protein n=1 Tax=Streptomyces antibioticus TaxID=1890 RepID=UPI003F47C082
MKAPETLRTFDGAEWELRATTHTGTALYAVSGAPKCCPPYVMATLTELAEHGIQSSELAATVAELGALPMPAGPAPQPLTSQRLAQIEAQANTSGTDVAVLVGEIRRLWDERHSTNEALDDAVQALEERAASALTVFRAQHDSIVMGYYTTAAEARKHCTTALRWDMPTAAVNWIEDDEDGIAELVAVICAEERPTGYFVAEIEIASAYDEEADQ